MKIPELKASVSRMQLWDSILLGERLNSDLAFEEFENDIIILIGVKS